jgi:hypothetical protein
MPTPWERTPALLAAIEKIAEEIDSFVKVL